MINIQVLKVMFNKMDSCIKMNRGGDKSFFTEYVMEWELFGII